MSLLLLLLFGLLSITHGFKQELRLVQADGKTLLFDKNVANLTVYTPLLKYVIKYCSKGVWDLYYRVDFEQPFKFVGSRTAPSLCSRVNMTDVKSFRHWAADDTLTDAISLYPNFFRRGYEILNTDPVVTSIKVPIRSIAISGTSGWTLFEGKHLNGKAICYTTNNKTHLDYFNLDVSSSCNENSCPVTVGSLIKTCNKDEIEKYKISSVVPKENLIQK